MSRSKGRPAVVLAQPPDVTWAAQVLAGAAPSHAVVVAPDAAVVSSAADHAHDSVRTMDVGFGYRGESASGDAALDAAHEDVVSQSVSELERCTNIFTKWNREKAPPMEAMLRCVGCDVPSPSPSAQLTDVVCGACLQRRARLPVDDVARGVRLDIFPRVWKH